MAIIRKIILWVKSLFAARTADKTEPTFVEQRVINRMTNWQRSQWGRAGYPLKPARLLHFLMLTKAERVQPWL